MKFPSPFSRLFRVALPLRFLALLLALMVPVGCQFWDPPVKVGVVGAFSGTGADLGINGRNGFQMIFPPSRLKYGIDGRKVEILYRDDRGDGDTALEIYRELESQGCQVVVSFQTSGAAERAFEFANRSSMVILSATASAAEWEGLDDQVFRIMTTTYRQGELLAKLATSEGKRKAFSLGSQQNQVYSRSVAQGFADQFKVSGGQIIESVEINHAKSWDLENVARAIKQSDADCLAPVSLDTSETASLALQLEKLGIQIPTYLAAWSLSGDLEGIAGGAVEGYAAVSFMNYFSPLPNYRKFREAYRSIYTQEPEFPALLGYEAAQMVDSILSHSTDLSSGAIKKSLLERDSFEGLQGPIVLNDYGDFQRPLFLYRFTGGRWEIIRL